MIIIVKCWNAESLDIVSICTWPPLHCEMVVAAAESGVKAILCEKPMALNLKEADQMLDSCEKSGTKLVVGHQHRFDPQVSQAIEWSQETPLATCNGSSLLQQQGPA